VSTSGQILDRQTRALTEAGCIRIFADKLSGKTAGRPELAACLDYLRPGDTLVVPSLDRLSRSLQDLITLVAGLRRRGVGFRSLHEALDTTTPGGRLVFHVFAALAEFIRELIVEGTREGLDAARARGQRLGAPGDDRRADPPGPRPAHPARQQHLQHRPAARRQPLHPLQVPARTRRRAPPSRRPDPAGGRHQARPYRQRRCCRSR
jgi:DNA invertase Pin-like site-specific DNA recombinase